MRFLRLEGGQPRLVAVSSLSARIEWRWAMSDSVTYPYDVFVSYRWVEPDQTWVRSSLVPALRAAGLKVLLDVEDFVPGRDLILEMSRAGRESRHAICVISPDYFEGNRMAGFESLAIRRSDPTGTESRLIPFILRRRSFPTGLVVLFRSTGLIRRTKVVSGGGCLLS